MLSHLHHRFHVAFTSRGEGWLVQVQCDDEIRGTTVDMKTCVRREHVYLSRTCIPNADIQVKEKIYV